MDKLILTQIEVADFTEMIREIIKTEIENAGEKKLAAKFLSVSEVCKLFNPSISRQTVDNWSNKGLLTKHHISGRVYYNYGEVMAAVTKIKKYNR